MSLLIQLVYYKNYFIDLVVTFPSHFVRHLSFAGKGSGNRGVKITK